MIDRGQGGRAPVTPGGLAAVLAAPLGLWVLTILLVSPAGEFPLNDDWVYARAVKDWMDTGTYSSHPFATATLAAQAWWGKLFCSLSGGFSFTALRWSTLTLWLAGAWAAGLAALGLGVRPWTAALAACLVIANPLTMNLGYTFMTDVPFMTLTALAGLCYLRGMGNYRWTWFLLGSLFGAGGMLVRQFAMFLPMALVVAVLPWNPRLRNRDAVPAVLALIAPWIAAWVVLRLLPSHAAELGYAWDPGVLGRNAFERAAGGLKFYSVSMTYLALCALPVAAGAMWYWLRRLDGGRKRRAVGLGAAFLGMAVVVFVSEPRRIPFAGNLIYDTGVGPMTIKGIFMGSYLWRPFSVGAWWWAPTLVGLLGAAWMAAGTLRWLFLIPGDGKRRPGDPRRRQQVFLMGWAVLMIAALYIPLVPVRFDRYFTGALAPVLLLAAMAPANPGRAARGVQMGLLALLYAFSVAGLQDYMAWNTARWAIANRLMESQGVPATEIDAGYEFNGWLTSPVFIEKVGAKAFLDSGPKYWWAVNDTYAISWLPRPGFEKLEEVAYDSWLAGEKGKLLLLKRKPGEEPGGG